MKYNLTDKITVPSQRTMTDSGQMIVPCAIARTGIQTYRGTDIGLKDDALVEVIREESEVFDEKSIATYRSAPVTIGHPVVDGKAVSVTSKNAKDLQVGTLEGLPVRDEDLLSGTVVIARQDAIDEIEGGTVELSVGYSCNIEARDGKYYQTDIKANHIAIVAKGRAGAACSIADEATNEDITDEGKDESPSDLAGKGNLTDSSNSGDSEGSTVSDAEEGGTEGEQPLGVSELQAIVDTLNANLDDAKEKLVTSEAKYVALEDSIDQLVIDRYDVIAAAKDLTDKEDFKGMTIFEIKSHVVVDVLDINLTDKNNAYVEARYDIICEDSANDETPLGRMLRKAAGSTETIVSDEYVNPVEAARSKMIERNSNSK